MEKDYKPSVDSSLGLVYRLNDLWSKVDYHSTHGYYDNWNNYLDALFRNLCFREDVIITGEGETLKVELSQKDVKIFNALNKKIYLAKKYWIMAKKKDPSKVKLYWSKRYKYLQLKDIWLRKLMYQLKLYLKETQKDLGGAVFGGFK